jgi:hypothetical protein
MFYELEFFSKSEKKDYCGCGGSARQACRESVCPHVLGFGSLPKLEARRMQSDLYMMSDRPTRFPQIKKTTKHGEFLRMVIIP